MTKAEQTENLVEKIRQHNFNYFVLNDPQISDEEFDLIYRELKELDENNEVFQESGDIPCYGIKVKHPEIMGSLDKAFNRGEMLKWIHTIPKNGNIIASPKIDGLAVRLEYRNGELRLAATRGRTGTEGQLITDNVRNIPSIPQSLGKQVDAEFRGEIYMTKSAFNDYDKVAKEKGWRQFKNPRNAAAGTATQKDPEKTARVELSFFCYEAKVDDVEFPTKTSESDWVKKNSDIDYVPLMKVNDITDLEKVTSDYESKIRASLNYNIDGLVFMVNEREVRDEMGWSGRCPKGAMAFKFKAENAESIVTAIDLQVGRTGVQTPVARILPTDIDGSTVSNITLHNVGMVHALGLTIGSRILFEKAGDIIPKVLEVLGGKGHFKFPEFCSSCGSSLKMDENDVSLWCENPACPAQLEERIHHYTKRLEILDVGLVTIQRMCNAGMVKNLSDLYKIDVDELAKLTGGKRSAEVVVNGIKAKTDVPLNVFLSSLGVHGLGRTTGKNLAKEFGTLEAVRELRYNDLIQINDIGPIMAVSIENGLRDISLEIDELIKYVNVIPNVQSVGKLSGSSFCITGTLQKPRKLLYQMIEEAGGEARSSVGKGLTYLVQSDPNSVSSKSKKALQLGVKIISEEELEEMM